MGFGEQMPVLLWNADFLAYVRFQNGLDGKESACNMGDLGLIPG